MKKKTNPKVSEYFRKLGKASWKKRQAKLIKDGLLKVGEVQNIKDSI